ncbi:hypothetical protein YC2023_106893 [Brassica napus]
MIVVYLDQSNSIRTHIYYHLLILSYYDKSCGFYKKLEKSYVSKHKNDLAFLKNNLGKTLCINYKLGHIKDRENGLSMPELEASTPRSGVQIPDYANYCRLQDIQVSSLGESGFLNNYANYRGKACKGSSTWCK